MVIVSFKDKEAEAIFKQRRLGKGMQLGFAKIAYRRLIALHNAVGLDDLRIPPGNRLEALKGDRAGTFSIRIND